MVDAVVLVPPLAKAASAVVAGYGFPPRFKVEVFDAEDAAHVVLDHTAADFPNPGCWPVTARFQPRLVKRVRFTATEPWSVDGPEILSLAEMMVLSGTRNLAIDAVVSSSSSRNAPRAWTRLNLIDMVTPLGLPLIPGAGGKLGYHSRPSQHKEERKTLTLTLPDVVPIDEIRLVPVRRRDVPLWFDYGFPELYTVEAATKEDFSDAVVLQDVTDELTPTPGMNFVCIPARRTLAKYIRITTKELWYRKNDYVFALAEMQVLRGDENLALQGHFSASDVLEGEDGWGLDALNDGLADGGRLISLPEWFTLLERRRVLEQERATLAAQRQEISERTQQQWVHGSVGGGGGIAVLSVLLLWRQHRQRLREAKRLRDKLARDLHDEIGSNLGSITLLCSFATQSGVSPEAMRSDLLEISRVAEETADSMRDMVDLLGARSPVEGGQSWIDVLRRLTERLLRGMELDCALPTAPLPEEPDLETRRELYLFCKEVLHNIARHAQASRVRFHLSPTRAGLRFEITDDGIGFDPSQPSSGNGLGNLRERAAAMLAQMDLVSAPGAGTRITLDLARSPRWRVPSP
jgi:signal transduction histidine kinase